jgi:hypothetical protein
MAERRNATHKRLSSRCEPPPHLLAAVADLPRRLLHRGAPFAGLPCLDRPGRRHCRGKPGNLARLRSAQRVAFGSRRPKRQVTGLSSFLAYYQEGELAPRCCSVQLVGGFKLNSHDHKLAALTDTAANLIVQLSELNRLRERVRKAELTRRSPLHSAAWTCKALTPSPNGKSSICFPRLKLCGQRARLLPAGPTRWQITR